MEAAPAATVAYAHGLVCSIVASVDVGLIHVRLGPLQSIFTPATLTIRTDTVSPTPSQMVNAPRVNFTSMNFANVRISDLGGAIWANSGFSDSVKAMVTSTCMLGTIDSIPPPAPNSTWSIDFYGPSLACSPFDTSLRSAIRDNIWTAMEIFYSGEDQVDTIDLINGYFLSWTPGVDQYPYKFCSNLQVMAYPNITEQSTELQPRPRFNITANGRSMGPLSGDPTDLDDFATDDGSVLKPVAEMLLPVTLYFAFVPNEFVYSLENFTLIQCELRNSSCNVSFNFVDGFQEVHLDVSTTQSSISRTRHWILTMCHQSVMDALGSIFIGLGYTEMHATELKRKPALAPKSSVLSTVIGTRAKELQLLRPNILTSFLYPGWLGTSIMEDTLDQFSLQDGIEKLFKNVTVNLMTAPMLH